MTPSELQLENDTLKQQLVVALAAIADRDAALADRDVKIEKLAHDLATLEAAVKRLLGSRRGGYRVPEGQGLLFPAASIASEVSAATATNAGNEADDGSGEDVSTARPAQKKGTPRKPRKIDTAGLPVEDRRHDVPKPSARTQ